MQEAMATRVQLACRDAETVVLRLRVLRAKLLCDTYSEECVAALQQARAALTTRLGDTAAQLRKVWLCGTSQWLQVSSQARAKVQAYNEAGPALAGLAGRYKTLCREVAHVQYSLDEVLGGLHAELRAE